MHTELVSIRTPTYPLDGAYYEPDNRAPSGAVLLLHGNQMNFYSGAPRFLPPALTSLGLACLAFNRRGHDTLGTRDSREPVGGAFQTAAEGIEDNRLAGAWLEERTGHAPVVIGHSNGGMLSVQHVSDHPRTPALVLLSAHGGGKDAAPLASNAGLLAGERYEEITAIAREMVARGDGDQLLLLPGWWNVVSASSFLNFQDELPDILELAPTIDAPTLYIRGDQEPADLYPAEEFAERCEGPCDVRIVGDCNHFYVGREDVVSDIVSAWLRATLVDRVGPRSR